MLQLLHMLIWPYEPTKNLFVDRALVILDETRVVIKSTYNFAFLEVAFLLGFEDGCHPVERESGKFVGEKHIFVHEDCWALRALAHYEVFRDYGPR